MKKTVLKAIRRYLRKHFPKEMDLIIKRADAILPELKAKAPDIGGRENSLSENLDMFLLFLSYYEASRQWKASPVSAAGNDHFFLTNEKNTYMMLDETNRRDKMRRF